MTQLASNHAAAPDFLHGVNLGGWLVLEKWMTPSLFEGLDARDEFTFMQTPGALEKLTRHRESFITEADFIWLASHGVNAVRIPVGYWLLAGDPPYAEGARYLDWAFDMAQKYDIKVLLDIHALPGSQNGNDHSGRIGEANWQRDATFRKQSLAFLKPFGERYGHHPALWGLEVINEPNAGAFQVALRAYYRRAYHLLDPLLAPGVKIVYADAWSPRIFAFSLLGKRRAVMDVHLYHMATLGTTTHSLDWYYRKLARKVRTLKLLSRLHPIIIGEWSGVVRGEVMSTLPESERPAAEHLHYELQNQLYTQLAGSFYWSYRPEGDGLSYWNYRSIVESQTVKK